jgi:hypothetical protein
MSDIYFLRPKAPQIWHGLYFISLRDPDGMTENQAAQKLRQLAERISQQYADLELELDDGSLNAYVPNE